MAMRTVSNDFAAQDLQRQHITDREALNPTMRAVADATNLIAAIIIGSITCGMTTLFTGSLIAGNVVGTMVFLYVLFSERTSISFWPDFSFGDRDVVVVPTPRRHHTVVVPQPEPVFVSAPAAPSIWNNWPTWDSWGGNSGSSSTIVSGSSSSPTMVSSDDGTGHAVVGGRKTT